MSKKEEVKQAHEIEVAFVLNTISKCLKTEPKVVAEKKIQVYRMLSKETVAVLKQEGYVVTALVVKEGNRIVANNVGGAYYEVSWE